MNNKTNISLTLPLRNNYDKITNRNGEELLTAALLAPLSVHSQWSSKRSPLAATPTAPLWGSSTADYAITYLDPFLSQSIHSQATNPFFKA